MLIQSIRQLFILLLLDHVNSVCALGVSNSLSEMTELVKRSGVLTRISEEIIRDMDISNHQVLE